MCKKVGEFEDVGGNKFKDATLIMKYIAHKTDLQPRSKELKDSCLDSTCTVVWRDGLARTGVTPLYWACMTRQEESALLLIRAGANVNDLSTREHDGEQLSSLYRASKFGQEQIVRVLLEKGANPFIGDGCPIEEAGTPEIKIMIENHVGIDKTTELVFKQCAKINQILFPQANKQQ